MKKWRISRGMVMVLIFTVMFLGLAARLFQLQILRGKEYQKSFAVKTTKKIPVKAARGIIRDRNGVVLADNRMTYSVTFEDVKEYGTTRERQLALNGTLHQLCVLIAEHGDTVENHLQIALDDEDNWQFTSDGSTLERFLADLYGKSSVKDLTEEQRRVTPGKVIAELEERYGLFESGGKSYTSKELTQYGMKSREELSREEELDILSIRYALSLTSYQKYLSVTVSRNISEETRAAVLENQDRFAGAAVAEDSIRVYPQGEAFASLLGYVGAISQEELLKREKDGLTINSVVGKNALEEYLDASLQGQDGERRVCVDNTGRVLQDLGITKEPQPGQDVTLTIDAGLQQSVYDALEAKIAEVLCMHFINEKTFDRAAVSESTEIRIPIYDAYCALFTNHVIDTERFSTECASDLEREILARYQKYREEVLSKLAADLNGENAVHGQQSTELQAYESLIAEQLGIIDEEKVSREMEERWQEGTVSLAEYLRTAAGNGWLEEDVLEAKADYLTGDEAYQLLKEYILEQLRKSEKLKDAVYEQMVKNDRILPKEACSLLYEQGILDKNDGAWDLLRAGELLPYDWMIQKIMALEITPAMLALEPCSGSAVITETGTGRVLACVSYPGYDNNRLANEMDVSYYYKLYNDSSVPMYNRATQQLSAPGSTFKPVTILAGIEEGVISYETEVFCDGVFDKVTPPLKCWNHSGHGLVSGAADALVNSCNDYLCEVSYRLGIDENEENFSDSKALETLQRYACMLHLGEKSGIELAESAPQVTDQYAIPSAIGQGTHNYATVQLARYVNILAERGRNYKLTLIGKTGNTEQQPKEEQEILFSESAWDSVHSGMEGYAESTGFFQNLPVSVAGKSGTAQESASEPDHGLFIGYAPADDPQISIAVRIVNGYDSTSAVSCAGTILEAYYQEVR